MVTVLSSASRSKRREPKNPVAPVTKMRLEFMCGRGWHAVLVEQPEVRVHRREEIFGRPVGDLVLCGHLLQDPRQCGVVNVTDVLEKVVDDVVVDAAKQMCDPKTLRGVIAGGEHVVFGPRVCIMPVIGFREVRMLVNVGAQKHHGHGQAGTELQDDKPQRHRAK